MKGRLDRKVHPSSFIPRPWACPRSSGVERLLGKEEVMSSNLIAGSSVARVIDLSIHS
jgi:hypothetical protein